MLDSGRRATMMIGLATLPAWAAGSPFVHLSHDDSPRDSLIVTQLAGELAEIENRWDSIDTTFDVVALKRHSDTEAPEWDDSEALHRWRFRWLSQDGLVRLERWVPLDDDNPQLLLDQLAVWDGATWRERFHERRVVNIRTEPRFDYFGESMVLFNGCRAPWGLGRRSLSESVSASVLMDYKERELSKWYRLRPATGDGVDYQIEMLHGAAPRLAALTIHIRDSGSLGSPPRLKLRLEYRVAEWGDGEDLLLAKSATRDCFIYHHDGIAEPADGSFAGRTLFIRRDSTIPSCLGTETWRVDSLDGDEVNDLCAGLQYRVGDDLIMIDGFPFRANQLLYEDRVEHLVTLIAGEGTDARDPVRDVGTQEATPSCETGVRPEMAGVVVAALTLLLILLWRLVHR
jgi:hypothetical protein